MSQADGKGEGCGHTMTPTSEQAVQDCVLLRAGNTATTGAKSVKGLTSPCAAFAGGDNRR